MALESIIAELRAILESEKQSRKRHRYQREETAAERMRQDLETGNRENWLENCLETEDTLG